MKAIKQDSVEHNVDTCISLALISTRIPVQ